MKRITSKGAFTLLELLTATMITTVVVGSVFAATTALQKSFLGNRAYTKGINDNNRVVDYITRDLRNASAVSRRTNGTSAPFKVGTFDLTATDELCVFVPGYYVSNVPDNSKESPYKIPEFSRSRLQGQPYYQYDTIVRIDGVTRVPNYPSTLEIRYTKRARSASDPTVCIFRTEIEGGTVRLTEDIAEKVESQTVNVRAFGLHIIQITSSFASKWTGEKYRDGSKQFSTVYLENYRSDARL